MTIRTLNTAPALGGPPAHDLRDDVDPELTHAQPRRILVTGAGATLPALGACRHPTRAAA